MLSFVWFSSYPFLSGTGGSENYTAGHIRELRKRGIESRLITIGLGENDGRADFPDISFLSLDSPEQLSDLDDTLVFVTYPWDVPTKRKAYIILHCPLSLCDQDSPYFEGGVAGRGLIAPSKFAASLWADYFERDNIPVAYPFAEGCFAKQAIPRRHDKKVRVLFGGRLTPDKGVYTLLAAMHFKMLKKYEFEFTATTACDHSPEGQIVRKLFEAHPHINLVPARKSPEDMASLLAQHDIVVMPSTSQFWHEAFGILSVEAQHTGCRVVASNAGGLPETNCGGLVLVEPDNPMALAKGLLEAAEKGRLTPHERKKAAAQFTVSQSVDQLLGVLSKDGALTPRLLH